MRINLIDLILSKQNSYEDYNSKEFSNDYLDPVRTLFTHVLMPQ